MEEKTYVFGQDNLASIIAPLLSQRGIDPAILACMNNRNGAEGGWFMWVIFLFFLMGWGGNGFGFGNRGEGGTDFLSAQIANTSGRDLLQQAIQGNGDAIRSLASTLNCDINSINCALSGLSTSLQSIGSQVGMSGLQVQNAVQSGNAALSAQLAQCCCENRLLTTQQGYENRIQSSTNTAAITSAIEDLRTDMTSQFCAVRERELQNKIDSMLAINTDLKGRLDNAAQTAQIQAALAPIQADVLAIKAAQPNTVPVPWPQLTAINTSPSLANLCYYSQYNNGSLWA